MSTKPGAGHIDGEDLAERVVVDFERFCSEQLQEVVQNAAKEIAQRLYKYLTANWPSQHKLQEGDVSSFRLRLERRWGKGLAGLRMLLTIVREWTAAAIDLRQRAKAAGTTSHLQDVMLRLLVRACQVTHEIVVLLESGLADAAMARWRTLHEIAVVSAVIMKYGEEIAERYVYYQIVESHFALKAYERDHKDLGFRPPSKRLSGKIRRDFLRVTGRFGKEFGKEYGWATHHLKAGRVTFAELEREAGQEFMRSPYKFASYNVHASPKGIYVKLGTLKPDTYLLGMSNAGLADPGQHAAVSLSQLVNLNIGHSMIFDDLVVMNVVERLKFEIPREFVKAHRKLLRDDRAYRKELAERKRSQTPRT